MTSEDRRSGRVEGLRLPEPVIAAMRAELAGCAERVVAAVVHEVPSYSEPFRGRMGRNIENAVALALGGFLDMTATGTTAAEAGDQVQMVFEAAYGLGRGEARSGRTMDALAAAYRVGARTAWHDLSTAAVEAGLPAADLARFAELVFDYIDELSDVSVSGHADELATTGRVRERHLERLALGILQGSDPDHLAALAERAEWEPPTTLTPIITADAALGTLRPHLDGRTLGLGSEAPGLEEHQGRAVVLIADLSARERRRLVDLVGDRAVVIGPSVPWTSAGTAYRRALRLVELGLDGEDHSPDAADHLVALVTTADPAALADLRARVLAPMAGLRPSTVEKLVETLRAWLLHQGRREEIATALFVHPQTVRYRVGRLRELYGDRLGDPQFALEATIALALHGPSWPGMDLPLRASGEGGSGPSVGPRDALRLSYDLPAQEP
ncbi:helix-turn-helix domain-containing protein [Nocardioides sp. AE5]|uniref:PucR family transcriptional regulator n=1 Tax=Nocardioides sp. AE5 TaxID=2962573 RepID=UPI00288117BC|nr:helix-turn-helix domain-containing protein [Nocardioides sp. AE5]MDT0200384.1 helix-turn-helix domain-containing protein [Nocardioides sp. AE5]